MACQRAQNFLKGPLRGHECATRTARARAIRPETKIRVRTPFSAILAFFFPKCVAASTRVATISDIFWSVSMWHELLVCGMAIVGTMGTARSKGECVTHAKSLILKVVGSQQLASIFCRKLLLAPPKPQNFPAARAQGGGLRPGSATLTATIIHAGPHTPSMSREEGSRIGDDPRFYFGALEHGPKPVAKSTVVVRI